eukprot:1156927-Pelagomonas_calceolata.AAC.11
MEKNSTGRNWNGQKVAQGSSGMERESHREGMEVKADGEGRGGGVLSFSTSSWSCSSLTCTSIILCAKFSVVKEAFAHQAWVLMEKKEQDKRHINADNANHVTSSNVQ